MPCPARELSVRFRVGTSPRIVSDELWDLVEPLLPLRERRFRHPGLKPLPDRDVLCGILYVLHTGIQWEYLPKDLGFGSGMSCWRRLRDWNEAGVWQRLHEILLAELNAAARLDWSRCVVDSSHVRALKGGSTRAPIAGLPGTSRFQASLDHRRTRHPARGAADRRQPQRRYPAPAPARRDPAGPRPGRPPPPQAGPCSPTGATTTTSTEARSAPAASCPRSPAAAPCTAPDWPPTAGSWRGHLPGCTASDVCGTAGNGEPTSTKHSSNSPVA
ncbi:hypothetical protein SUDANB91_00097 [Streptomyces sp. SudanB91_2054]